MVGGTQAEFNKREEQTTSEKETRHGHRVERCVYFLPQVAFVGGVLDVVADVVVHSMSCCAVSSIKNLGSKYKHKKSEPELVHSKY